MPAPAVAAAVIRGINAARSAASALQKERAAARKAKAVRQAMKVKSDLKAKSKSMERMAKKLKELKKAGWLIKGVTLGGTSFGDVLLSLSTLLIWGNIELFIFPYIIPWWKQELWEKLFTIMLDVIVFTILMITVGVVYYFIQNPSEACNALSAATAEMFLLSFGLNGSCKLVGKTLQWVAN